MLVLGGSAIKIRRRVVGGRTTICPHIRALPTIPNFNFRIEINIAHPIFQDFLLFIDNILATA